MPPWLQRLLGANHLGLQDAIFQVLGRNDLGAGPPPLGSKRNPVRLPEQVVVADEPFFSPMADDTALVRLIPEAMDSVRQFEGSPLLNDTLIPLVRRQGRPDPKLVYDWLPSVEGQIHPGMGWYSPSERDTVALTNTPQFHHQPYDEVLRHEFGHSFEARGISPRTVEEVSLYYAPYRALNPNTYGATNQHEFFAQTFGEAVSLMGLPLDSSWERQVAERTHHRPELLVAMRGLLDSPLYRNHPAADRIRALAPPRAN